MKANSKYTALELLTEAGVETPQDKFGKVRIVIGGLSGIVNPDHLIRVQPGTKKLSIIVGVDPFEVELEDAEEGADSLISEGARAVLDAKGAEINKLTTDEHYEPEKEGEAQPEVKPE